MILSDIPILGAAVFPSPLLSNKVTIKMMPLFLLLEFKPSQYLMGFQVSWDKNFLKVILVNVFLAQFVLLMKVN
jgi:hypothetical protein